VRFGAVFPHADFGNDRGAIRDFAQGVEALGFDHLVTYDHVLSAQHATRTPPLTGPYDETHEFHEPFVLFGYLGAVTDTIDLVVGVLVAPQRQTALIAKQAAEVQALSGGRLRLGLGTGWNWVEYESLGADFDRRGAVLDEQAALLRRLWQEPLVAFDGDFHRIDRASIRPLPDVPIPLWFGGYSPRALRRSAQHGDGHLFGHLATVSWRRRASCAHEQPTGSASTQSPRRTLIPTRRTFARRRLHGRPLAGPISRSARSYSRRATRVRVPSTNISICSNVGASPFGRPFRSIRAGVLRRLRSQRPS